MTFLIEILLPVTGETKDNPDARTALYEVREELTKMFGGVTTHVNAPAEGLWEEGGEVARDRIVVVEVMTDDLDRDWWASYRLSLEARLHQQEIVIRTSEVERL